MLYSVAYFKLNQLNAYFSTLHGKNSIHANSNLFLFCSCQEESELTGPTPTLLPLWLFPPPPSTDPYRSHSSALCTCLGEKRRDFHYYFTSSTFSLPPPFSSELSNPAAITRRKKKRRRRSFLLIRRCSWKEERKKKSAGLSIQLPLEEALFPFFLWHHCGCGGDGSSASAAAASVAVARQSPEESESDNSEGGSPLLQGGRRTQRVYFSPGMKCQNKCEDRVSVFD